jgi:small-conductance mechanosensitive channel
MRNFFLNTLVDTKYLRFNLLELIIIIAIIVIALILNKIINNQYNNKLAERVDKKLFIKSKYILWLGFITIIFFILVPNFIDLEFINYGKLLVKPYNIIVIAVIILLTLLLTRLIRIYFNKNKPKTKRSERRSLFFILSLIWIVAISLISKTTIVDFQDISEYILLNIKEIPITVTDIFFLFFIMMITSIISMIFNLIVSNQVESGNIDIGTSSAINQIVKYFLWIIAFSISLRIAGFKLSILLAGSAALLVGFGIGIKEIFSDIASGIIILMERTLIVGDIVEVDGLVGRVKNIGLRTTSIITRDNTWIIVPNSKFTRENVLNWSHTEKNIRFFVEVGVAYGSDVQLVMKVLKECATSNESVSDNPEPLVLLEKFDDFSLDFKLLFWTSNVFSENLIKSDIRVLIEKKFRENGIVIPFPITTVQIMK